MNSHDSTPHAPAPQTPKQKAVAAIAGTLLILLFGGIFWLMAGTDGERCSDDTDCRIGMYACVSGSCRAACDADEDCNEDYACLETSAVNSVTSSVSTERESFCIPTR